MPEPITNIGILSKQKIGESNDISDSTVFGKLNNLSVVEYKIDTVDEIVDDIKIDTDKIGELNSIINVPYSFGINPIIAHLNTNYYHIHGKPFIHPNKADPVTLQSASGAWATTGTITTIASETALTLSSFDIHWINISDISGNAHFVIDLYAYYPTDPSTPVLIGSTRGWRSSNFISEGAKRIQIPQMPAGTKISGKLSDSTSGQITVAVSLEGHYYTGA